MLLSGGCGGDTKYERGASDWSLYRSLAQADTIEVASPTKNFSEQLEARWKARAPRSAERTRFRTLGGNAGAGEARILIGTPDDGVPTQLARRVGAEVIPGQGFRIFDQDFFDPGDALRAVMEDPRRPGMPLTLWFGNDLNRLRLYLDDLHPRWQPHLDVFARGDLAFSYPLNRDAVADLERGVDYGARRAAAAENAAAAQMGRVRVWGNEDDAPNPARLAGYVQAMLDARDNALRALDVKVTKKKPGPLVEVYLSGKPEELSAILGGPALSRTNPIRRSVDALLGRGLPDDQGAAVAEAAVLAAVGPPSHPWMLEGLGTAATGAWWNHPLDELVGLLVEANMVPTLEQIVDPASEDLLSPHVLGPLRGQLMRFLLEDLKPKNLRSLWRGVRPWKIDGRVRTLWRESLQKVANSTAPVRAETARQRSEQARDALASEFRAGFVLADSRTGEQSDYLGGDVVRRLDEARDLGAKSFSVVVQVPLFAGPLKEDDIRPGIAAASASDLALFATLSRGGARGLAPILVLELISADSGPRADQAALDTPGDWEAFFLDTLKVVQHYALLAELAGVEVLCLGSELTLATRTAPPEDEAFESELARELREVRAKGWIATTKVARSLFKGSLVTSVRTVKQAEDFAQWRLFDALGVELWPRFDDREGVSPDLEGATRTYGHLLRRYNQLAREGKRPLLVMQAGFPARAGSWKTPWQPRGPEDAEAQILAYQALRDAVRGALEDSLPLAGLQVWTLPLSESEVRGFAPASDAARATLTELFAHER